MSVLVVAVDKLNKASGSNAEESEAEALISTELPVPVNVIKST